MEQHLDLTSLKRPWQFKDKAGQRFGKLVVQSFLIRKNGRTYWICKCDCGNLVTVKLGPRVNSCGCLRGLLANGVYKNRIGRMLSQARARAKRDGLPFDLTPSDIEIPDICPVLGIKLSRGIGRGGHCDSSPSLDQMRPGAGYTKGNVRVISNRANVLKGNGTAEEHKAIANYIEGFSSGEVNRTV